MPQSRESIATDVQGVPTLVKGVALGAMGYGCFSVQDAAVKWLIVRFPVPEILLLRSLVVIVVALALGGRRNVAALRHSRNKLPLAMRAAFILTAWLSYYAAAAHMQLAQLTTLYFAAPIVAVVLAVVVLRERVDAVRWLAVGVGFVGVVFAADPFAGTLEWRPAALALLGACLWGLSVVLVRLINRTESTATQMLVTNAFFALACAAMMPGLWLTPDPFSLGLMLMIGVMGGLGQFLLYEGYRYAPASVLAPIEYTGLVWAFVYGYAIWSEIPGLNVFVGAALIVGSSLVLVGFEHRRARRLVREATMAARQA